MGALLAKPAVCGELLDPAGRSLHKWVQHTGYTIDIVRSPGTHVPHRHAGLEFVFVHGGTTVWRVGDSLHVLLPGDVLIFDAAVPHGSRPVTGLYTRTTIHVMPDMIGEGASALLAAVEAAPVRLSLPEADVPSVFGAICRLRACHRAGASLAHARTLLATIAGHLDEQPARGDVHPVLRDVLDYMTLESSADETVDTLAARFYVSAGHLFYLFRNVLGCTPQKLWRTIKVERTCSRILAGKPPVEELAALSGFESRRGFQRAFKRVTGMSVETFRNLLQESLSS